MKLWDNDLRNIYKQPELNAYYCIINCWSAPRRASEKLKKGLETAVNNTKKAVETTKENVTNAVNDAATLTGALAGKATSGIAEKIEDYGNSFGRAMQDIGDKTHTSGFFDALGNRTGLKQLGQNIHTGFQYGAGLLPEEEAGPAPMPDGDEDKGAQTKAETDKAAAEAAGAGAGAEREAANTAKEGGVNAARAGNMAGANNSAQALTNGLYQAGAAQNAATQADYRDKMAQADIMDTQAGNMAKGAKLQPWNAGLQGLGQGFQLGMLSDENSKEAPVDGIDDDKLKEAIEQFKSLYAQLQEIKKWEC